MALIEADVPGRDAGQGGVRPDDGLDDADLVRGLLGLGQAMLAG